MLGLVEIDAKGQDHPDLTLGLSSGSTIEPAKYALDKLTRFTTATFLMRAKFPHPT